MVIAIVGVVPCCVYCGICLWLSWRENIGDDEPTVHGYVREFWFRRAKAFALIALCAIPFSVAFGHLATVYNAKAEAASTAYGKDLVTGGRTGYAGSVTRALRRRPH